MAQPTNRQPPPILPPSTPSNSSARPSPTQPPQTLNGQKQEQLTPTSEARMNPPPVPRSSMVTPARDTRESSVMSSGGSSRKPRQNLDERDHLLMVKHCFEQRENFKEGTKAQFWTGVNAAFQEDTGKVLAQMSATVGRLVEARRRQILDWETGVIPQKPGGELNDKLDEWMAFLKVEDSDAEAERTRQVEARRKVEEQRKEARRQAIAAESLANAQNPQARMITGPAPPPEMQQQQQQQPHHHQQLQPHQPPPQPQYHQPPPPPHGGPVVHHPQPNGEVDVNGRPNKRKRMNERQLTQELQQQIHHGNWQAQQAQQYAVAHPPEPPRRVVVEGAMTKEDWREVMGNDARLRALETKVDKIELLLTQNNKLLLQLVSNQNSDRSSSKERDRHAEEERVPVHLDAEFERDYLSGAYAKTPRPIP